MKPLVRLWHELRRRKVVRVAGVYLLAAWLVLQVGDVVVEPLRLPPWTMTLLIVLIALGFPVAVALAWAFDVTPSGVRRTDGLDTAHDSDSADAAASPDAAPSPAAAPSHGASAGGQRRLVAGVGIGVLIGLVGFGAYSGWPGGESGHAAPTSRRAVAILPFDVDGAGSFDYLRDGLVKILSAKLDGAAELRSVDPNALLARLGGEPAPMDPDRAREIAAEFGAGRFILGSVIQLGATLHLEAALYDGGPGTAPAVRATVDGAPDDVLGLIDELAARLLAGQFTEPGARLARSAALTTRSLPALREYLAGERLMREGETRRASENFRMAVDIDSTFALAWYRLSSAAGWSFQPELATRAIEAALRHGDRLSPLDRSLVEAQARMQRGEFAAAEAAYRRLVAEYPDNVEAWYQLGEVLIHGNQLQGRSPAESRNAFRRALLLDPGNSEIAYHLVHLALSEGDDEELEALARTMTGSVLEPLRRNSELFAAARGDAAAQRRELQRLRALPDDSLDALVDQVLIGHLPREFADSLLALLDARLRTDSWADMGAFNLGLLGGWNDFESAMLDGNLPEKVLGLAIAAGYMPYVPVESVARTRRAFLRLEPEIPPGTGPDRPHYWFDSVPRLYVDGLLAVRLDDPTTASDAAESLEREARSDGAHGPLLRRLAAELRARVAWHAGDAGRALDILEAADREPYPLLTYLIRGLVTNLPGPRWLRAELLYEVGRHDESLGWFEGFRYWGGLSTPVALLRTARIHEREGRIEEAKRAYALFLDAWRRPDPHLELVVEEARRDLARLMGEAAR